MLKIMSLNIWGGHVYDKLLNFIKKHQNVDIFCFQEVYHKAKEKISTDDTKVYLNILSELNALLPNHQLLFSPMVDNIYGLGMLVKNNINIVKSGEINTYENPNYIGKGPTHPRVLQFAELQFDDKDFLITNYHGFWNGINKLDSIERIEQSRIIKEFTGQYNIPKILCGDFNLRPDTKSIAMLEESLTNQIKNFDIKSTRTKLYKKPEKFADYIFTSPEFIINKFEVLDVEVSDHSPLLIEVSF